MQVLNQNGIPLYHQLKEIFLEKIADGEWKPGEIIPAETVLCHQYGVSRGPLRQALDILVKDGLLTRKQGKGTMVLPPKIERGLSGLYSFTMLIEQKGMKASARLLSFETSKAYGTLARSLEIPGGTPVHLIRRLRLANNEPLVLEKIFIEKSLCPDLTQEQVASSSLFTLLAENYNLPPLSSRQTFEPTLADEFEAEVLKIETGAPVLLLQNITYTQDEKPILFSKATMRGDRVRYYIELKGQITSPHKFTD